MNEKYIKFLPLVAKIHELALLAPESCPVFVYWSPHCASIDVSIFKGKWHVETNDRPAVKATAYLDRDNGTEQLEAMVKLISTCVLAAQL